MTSIKKALACAVLFAVSALSVVAQNTGTLRGVVTDQETGEELIGATVSLVGTYKGTVTDIDGSYVLPEIKPGDYSVKVQFIGYGTKLFTGIAIKAGENTVLNIKLSPNVESLQEVTVVGQKQNIDLELASSEITFRQEEIAEMNVRDVTELVGMQAGVVRTQDGLQIRGARVYETEYLVDGISAQDPLAGTGFGVNVNSSAIQSLNLVTGGAGAEFGGGSSGVISTQIREGGDHFEISGRWQRDYISNPDWNSSFNTDLAELTMGFPIGKKKKLKVFNSATMLLTDHYFGATADQLVSSILPNSNDLWAHRYDNQYTHTFKLSYQFKPGTKITLTNQHSLTVNQNTRALQIIGFDAILQPGFQYARSNNLDNATTYTHHSNLTVINASHLINKNWGIQGSFGRLFTALRADANGRPFRTATVDQIFDESNIISDPIGVFNPGDPSGTYFVLPGDGLVNNGGITPVWHDHHAEEYTIKGKVNYFPDNKTHEMSFGFEHLFTEYQWVDVARPWVGAPIKIDEDNFTPSVSIGSSSDVWFVRPQRGGLFFQDKITYKGIIATLGMRMNYWAPGRFADEAVADPNSPVLGQIREDYNDKTVGFAGLRWKARLLPRINVSFPVTENNVLYFNYGHSMRMPHPRFMYAGLDPVFENRFFLSSLGNPDLDPEVNVSYEVGVKSMVTKDLAMTFTAYNNNRFDYIVARRVITNDRTGRPVSKTMYINQDYAQIFGVEVGAQYRLGKLLTTFSNVSYQVARGKSNSARESALQIEQTGEIQLARVQYLAWDRPWTINSGLIFAADSTIKIKGFPVDGMKSFLRLIRLKSLASRMNSIPLNGLRAFMSFNYTSGFRYTPQRQVSVNDLGRPEFEVLNDQINALNAAPWINFDLKVSYDFLINKKKRTGMTFSVEARNLFSNLNAQIINPITGRGYEFGDDVPNTWRDPRPEFNGPQERGLDPRDPARYLPPRQILFGVDFKF
ncbi:MAG: TonB-dependent receptor [Schleiferiaceae bacterium]|nr:TonB-dependent receptor [Schleiferiaceae bacterium]